MAIFNTVPPLAAGTGLAFDGETIALAADATLSKQGLAADAKATGDTIRKAADSRNLLDNWDFARPVNQRGKTSYSGARIYTIDRWMISTTAGAANVVSGGIKLTGPSSGIVEFFQGFENPIPSGTQVTVSILYSQESGASNGAIRFTTAMVNGAVHGAIMIPSGEATKKLLTGTITLEKPAACFVIRVPNGGALTVHAVKVEYGDVCTLTENSSADYAEELTKCQRFFVKVTGNISLLSATTADIKRRVAVTLPRTMRATPSITWTLGTGSEAPNLDRATPDMFSLAYEGSNTGFVWINGYEATADM